MAPHTPQRWEAPRLSRDAPRPSDSFRDSDMVGSSEPTPPPVRRRVVITGMGTVNALTSGGASAGAEGPAPRPSAIRPLRGLPPAPGPRGAPGRRHGARAGPPRAPPPGPTRPRNPPP